MDMIQEFRDSAFEIVEQYIADSLQSANDLNLIDFAVHVVYLKGFEDGKRWQTQSEHHE